MLSCRFSLFLIDFHILMLIFILALIWQKRKDARPSLPRQGLKGGEGPRGRLFGLHQHHRSLRGGASVGPRHSHPRLGVSEISSFNFWCYMIILRWLLSKVGCAFFFLRIGIMVAVGLAMIGALGCFLFDSKWIVGCVWFRWKLHF